MKYLTYIESTGTQYIDTGFSPAYNSRVVADVSDLTTEDFVFGARDTASSSASKQFGVYISSASAIRSDYFGTTANKTPSDISARTSIDKNANVTSAFGLTVANTSVSSGQVSHTLYLFALNNAGIVTANATMKLYSCQIYDNDDLVRDFIPVENDDGEIGLYDKVNKVFYSNAGTGTFTAGEYISVTTGDILPVQFTGLTNNTTYYGKIFTVNFKGRINNRADLTYCSAYPTNIPSKITNFTLSGSEFTVSLSWTNPTSNVYSKTIIVQKNGSAPTSLTDGTQVYSGTGTSTTITDLDELTTYYYAAFAVNSSNGYASGFPTKSYTTPSAIPAEPTTWQLSKAITSSSSTWTADPTKWYRIWVIGASGTGSYYTSGSMYTGATVGCAGGNSGGLAGSVLYGADIGTVTCTVNSSITSFGSFLSATSGGSGVTSGMTMSSSDSHKTPSATVGSGSGGNRYNLSGYKGGAGGTKNNAGSQGGNSGAKGGAAGNSSAYYKAGGGGGGARLPVPYDGFPYIATTSQMSTYKGGQGAWLYRENDMSMSGDFHRGTKPTAYPSISTSSPLLYGGGQGAGGIAYCEDMSLENEEENTIQYQDEICWPTGTNNKTHYTTGSSGIIIIEEGA